jgi:sortase A
MPFCYHDSIMPAYSYIKAVRNHPKPQRESLPTKDFSPANIQLSLGQKKFLRHFAHIIPNVLVVVGATAVTVVMLPFISYQVSLASQPSVGIISPIPEAELDSMRNLAQAHLKNMLKTSTSPVQAHQESGPIVVDNIDYTKVDNWFPGASKPVQFGDRPKVNNYTISIPKIKVENMEVEIGGNDLDEHLIHYDGTALPGQYGNPVIFGHSILPIFNNPKNYMSVFTMLPTLKKNDEIKVDYDGISYKYLVESYHEVAPEDIEVLEQRYDRRTITLITCVPPGTYLRRGVIQARLVEDK